MEVWEAFGQKIDLCVRVREILTEYSEGTGVLKELIQVMLAYDFRAQSRYHRGRWDVLTACHTLAT